MVYNLSNDLQKSQFLTRASLLAKRGGMVELTEKKQRTLSQNSYLWLVISYWGTQTGYTKDEAEQVFKDINRDIFYQERYKEHTGLTIVYVRHTYELSVEEMNKAIEKFRNWSAANDAFPVYIPSPEDNRLVEAMEYEVERCRNYL